jgi:hypothetical protein
MGTRENKVEVYLKQRVKEQWGLSRKWVSPGHDGVPDQIVWIPEVAGMELWLVEVKTEDGKYEKSQVREHFRLRKVGLRVRTVFGARGVDRFTTEVTSIRNNRGTPHVEALWDEQGVYEVTKCWGEQWEEFQR